jgi:hypothetical protein
VNSAAEKRFEGVIAPRKARTLAIVGGLLLIHAALLLWFWPHQWPVAYKWLLLPDSVSAYLALALGIQHCRTANATNESRP